MTVYIELILLDNFTADFLLLMAAMRVSARRVRPLRAVFGAAIGGIYALVAALVPTLSFAPVSLAVCISMCAIAHGIRPLRAFFHYLFIFLAIAALFGGCVFAVVYALGGTLSSGVINLPILRYLLIGGTLGVLLYEIFCRRTVLFPACICTVEAFFGSHSIVFSATPDSGARIVDDTGGGVIVIQDAFLEKACPSISSSAHKTKYFTIHTASGSVRLKGVLPDKLVIRAQEGVYEARAYLVLAENISLDGCPALIGKGVRAVKIAKESHPCKTNFYF